MCQTSIFPGWFPSGVHVLLATSCPSHMFMVSSFHQYSGQVSYFGGCPTAPDLLELHYDRVAERQHSPGSRLWMWTKGWNRSLLPCAFQRALNFDNHPQTRVPVVESLSSVEEFQQKNPRIDALKKRTVAFFLHHTTPEQPGSAPGETPSSTGESERVAREHPAAPSTQDAAKEARVFLTSPRILKWSARLRHRERWEHSIPGLELTEGMQILLSTLQNPLGSLPTNHWRCLTSDPLSDLWYFPVVRVPYRTPSIASSLCASPQAEGVSFCRWPVRTHGKLAGLCRTERKHTELNYQHHPREIKWEASKSQPGSVEWREDMQSEDSSHHHYPQGEIRCVSSRIHPKDLWKL